MRKVLLRGVAVGSLLLATSVYASAADPVADAVDWSGFYIGGHAGYGEAYTNGCYDCDDSEVLFQEDLDLKGVLAGVQAGYNFQMDSLVFGIEADASFMNWDDVITDVNSTNSSNTAAEVDMLASVRGRLGVAMDDVLLFATAGVAIADAESSLLNSGSAFDVDYNDIGGVVGGGAEWAQTDSLRWRVEGLYYFFGDKGSVEDAHSGNAGEEFELEDAFTVRVGMNWYIN